MKFSIIVPVYNTKIDYLDECIKSILNQTYKKFELIIVDDGSSNKDVKEYLKNIASENVKIFFNENHGVSYSRNFGAQKSNGNYLIFVDSDDLISNHFLENASKILLENELDLLLSNITFEKNRLLLKEFSYENISDKNELLKYYLTFYNNKFKNNNGYINRGPVCRVVKRNIFFNNMFDEDVRFAEDVLWNVKLIKKIDSIGYLKQENYYYRKNEGSTTLNYHKNFDVELIDVLKRIYDELDGIFYNEFCKACFEYFIIYLKLDLFNKANNTRNKYAILKILLMKD